MNIQVVFYGRLKELVEQKKQTYNFDDDTVSINSVVGRLCKQYTSLEKHLESVAFVVNDEVVDVDFIISDGDEISLLPPVSGG